MAGCTEETILVVGDIPAERGCVILTDCNTVVVSKYLAPEDREKAIDREYDRGRREWLRPVA